MQDYSDYDYTPKFRKPTAEELEQSKLARIAYLKKIYREEFERELNVPLDLLTGRIRPKERMH